MNNKPNDMSPVLEKVDQNCESKEMSMGKRDRERERGGGGGGERERERERERQIDKLRGRNKQIDRYFDKLFV